MKLYYIANARMPNEKAHGIQIAKMCEAFIAAGTKLVLVVPKRTAPREPLKEFYGLGCEVPLVKIPTLNLYLAGPVGFAVSSFFFVLCTYFYLIAKKIRGEKFVLYTVDMDNFSYALLPLVGDTFAEMHTPKEQSKLQQFFFNRVRGVIATNNLIRQKLIDDYALPEAKIISEPNGVDFKLFATALSRQKAREQLSLPKDTKIVLYVGRFYQWKGLEVLPQACEKLPTDIVCYVVGGTKEEFMQTIGVTQVPTNLVFTGARQAREIPVWLRAADALLLLGTAKNEDSNRYTSPMKLFEYMASGTPIVASATPAVSDVLTQREGFLYEPDNAASLVQAIGRALSEGDASERAKHAQVVAHTHTWDMRAERILAFIHRTDTLQ